MTAAPDHTPILQSATLAQRVRPWLPVLLVPAIVALGFLVIANASSWMTLMFGLMDGINFGHGAFRSSGALVGVSVLIALSCMTAAPSLTLNLLALPAAVAAAMAMMFLVCVVVIIGGLGSVEGAFIGALLVGPGACGVALATVHPGRGWGALAVAFAVAVLVAQMWRLTGGEDGMNIQSPRELMPAFRTEIEIFGTRITGRILHTHLVFACCTALFLLLLRIVNSPFGRVLQAIRENPFRAEAIGYRMVVYRTGATCLWAGVAALAGSLFAMWLRYVVANTTLSMAIMIDILLMVVIRGMGAIWGAVVGATIIVLAKSYLQNLIGAAERATEGLPLVPDLLNPDRRLLWLGVAFILSVYFFPAGVVGRLRAGK